MAYTPRRPSAPALTPGDWEGINSLIIATKCRAGSGWIYRAVTVPFPYITEVWHNEEIPADVIVTLQRPGETGQLPRVDRVRQEIPIDGRMRAQIIRSRDYVATKQSVLRPGTNLQPGDVMQMPMDFGDWMNGALDADPAVEADFASGQYLQDPEAEWDF